MASVEVREAAVTAVYLSASEVADRIGVVPSAISRYKMPPPDALIGKTRGWLPDTIDEWNRNRPGRGARTDLRGT
ncbi:MAG: XRE family transcriptional regulator [Gordonia sp. (in: high G+C Gram-positive bacteria)]|jgi:hypothetical protein|nr:XRE family transcriptional regulator [Gordonia sp. (in: high G+C Gram-positive bacteria)]